MSKLQSPVDKLAWTNAAQTGEIFAHVLFRIFGFCRYYGGE